MSMIVEPVSPGVLPPSTMASICPSREAITSPASEHSRPPERLALVAVIGPQRPLAMRSATGLLVSRIPILFVPAVKRGRTPFEALNIMVRPPGQKCSMRRLATGGIPSARRGRSFTFPIITGTGFFEIPPLDPKDLFNRGCVVGVSSQTVKRLGWIGDHSACLQNGNHFLYGGRIGSG